MKRCAQCHGKLGLGIRARNVWNGRWWLRIRFCSTYCEALYELERYDGNADRWHTLLGRLNPQNCLVSDPGNGRTGAPRS
jgi:hypothetical protein